MDFVKAFIVFVVVGFLVGCGSGSTPSNTVNAAISPSATIVASVNTSQLVTVTFNTDKNTASNLTVSFAPPLPSGWTESNFKNCDTVQPTGNGCTVQFTFAPTSTASTGTLSFNYLYQDAVGQSRQETVNISYGVSAANASDLIPSVQSWQPYVGGNAGEKIHLNKNNHTVIYYSTSDLQSDANTLSQDLQSLQLQNVTTQFGAYTIQSCPADAICLIETPGWDQSVDTSETNSVVRNLIKTQGYQLSITPQPSGDGSITILADGNDGIFYGTRTLLQLFAQTSPSSPVLPASNIYDWPATAERSMMLDVGRKFYSATYLQQLVRTLSYFKINFFHIHLSDWNAFRLNDPTNFPGLAPANESYSESDMETLKQLAEKYHVSLVPEIDIPGHAVAITQYYANTYAPAHPGLPATITFDSTTCPTMSSMTIGGVTYAGWTIDVLNSEGKTFVEQLVKNFMPWFGSENGKYPHQGKYFHLGADEYQNNAAMIACPDLIDACKDKSGNVIAACEGPANPSDYPIHSAVEPGGLFVQFLDSINGDVFQSATTNPDGTKMRLWTGWNAATDIPGTSKYSTSPIDPDTSTYIDSWLADQDPNNLLNAGFHIMNTSYQMVYLTPGFAIENWDFSPPESYLLNTWTPNIFISAPAVSNLPTTVDIHNPNYLGTGFEVWSDGDTTKSDSYFDTLLQNPLKLIANAAWIGAAAPATPLSQFIERVIAVGSAPGIEPSDASPWQLAGQTVNLQGTTAVNQPEIPTPWTFAAWVKLGALGSGNQQIIVQSPLTDDNTATPNLSLVIDPATGRVGYINGIDNESHPYAMVGTFYFNYTLPTNTWTYLTFVGTQAGVALYVNGALQDSQLPVMNLPMQTLGDSGNTQANTLYSPYAINRALNVDQIIEQMNQNKPS